MLFSFRSNSTDSWSGWLCILIVSHFFLGLVNISPLFYLVWGLGQFINEMEVGHTPQVNQSAKCVHKLSVLHGGCTEPPMDD